MRLPRWVRALDQLLRNAFRASERKGRTALAAEKRRVQQPRAPRPKD